MKITKISQKLSLENYYTIEIARNPNTSPEILAKILSRGYNDVVSHFAALNHNCPPEALAMVLSRGNDDNVSCFSAHNLNCPPEALAMVLSRGNDDGVSRNASSNYNCPPEALAGILSRGNNDEVSWYASRNPSCPDLSKIRWMQATGQIEKEDPSKHIIEYDSKEEKDEDLEKLERLISKNKNWYKKYLTAHMSADIAKETDLPRWLKLHKIISRTLNITPSKNIDLFLDISDTLRALTNELNRLPRLREFMEVWYEKHPKSEKELISAKR